MNVVLNLFASPYPYYGLPKAMVNTTKLPGIHIGFVLIASVKSTLASLYTLFNHI